jgi:hypothetical protein
MMMVTMMSKTTEIGRPPPASASGSDAILQEIVDAVREGYEVEMSSTDILSTVVDILRENDLLHPIIR